MGGKCINLEPNKLKDATTIFGITFLVQKIINFCPDFCGIFKLLKHAKRKIAKNGRQNANF